MVNSVLVFKPSVKSRSLRERKFKNNFFFFCTTFFKDYAFVSSVPLHFVQQTKLHWERIWSKMRSGTQASKSQIFLGTSRTKSLTSLFHNSIGLPHFPVKPKNFFASFHVQISEFALVDFDTPTVF